MGQESVTLQTGGWRETEAAAGEEQLWTKANTEERTTMLWAPLGAL